MTFSSRRKRRTILPGPTRCARSLISLAAGWLLAAGAARAQTQITSDLPEIVVPRWGVSKAASTSQIQPQNNAAPPEFVMPQPGVSPQAPAPRFQNVTFWRPAVAQARDAVQAAATQQVQPGQLPPGAIGEAEGFTIRIDLPGIERQTRRWSEDQFFEALRLESQTRVGAQRVFFPERVPVTREKYKDRQFNQTVAQVEPGFVVHRRLLFEQKNFDRHGWELGALQPGISVGCFFYDVVVLPYHCWTRPLEKWDSSAGKVLPGDNVPLMFNREEFSVTGLLGQSGAMALGFVAFP